ncbi:SprT-like family-domain-containing protein [Rostrohypoxylon terebratum]|nr:SprT-like family-domain-containing protein [Rostrohypoxylon terebratum]
MPDVFGDSSEDEFPDVDVVVRDYRHKVKSRQEEPKSKRETSRKEHDAIETPAVKSTPLRRRKLGQNQTTDQTLLKPWGKTVTSNEEKNQPSNPRLSRPRVRAKEEIIEPDFFSRDVPELKPKVLRQGHRVASSSTDARSISERAENNQGDYNVNPSKARAAQFSKKLTKSPTPSEESDILEDISESSEEEGEDEEEEDEEEDEEEGEEEDEVSEFVSDSDSDSDSETDTWNSGSEHSVTPPTRRSKSPIVQWANPQKTLLKGSDKNSAPSNKQPQATTINRSSRQRETHKPLKTLKAPQPGNLEDAFKKLQIFNEDSELEEASTKMDKKPILEPTTPKKTLKEIPVSPLKTPKIPASPWKPEHKEFWDSEAHFGWIDKHSPDKKPEKKPESPRKPKLMEKELRLEAMRKYATSPEKKQAQMAFDRDKDSLASSFLQELDDRITDGKLSELTAETGGLRIVWSKLLLTTAGRAHWKCKMHSTVVKGTDGAMTEKQETRQHSASIELSTRVLNNPSDLLNTVAHEFCHLAVFILIGKPKSPHGAEFKSFGAKCGRVFGDRGIEVTTKHDYQIEFKYIWECEDCHLPVKRHSRSVNVVRQRCGACHGTLRQVKPPPRGTGTSTPTATASSGANASASADPSTGKKKPSAWQEFLSQEMKKLSKDNPKMTFRDKMAAASAKWGDMQKEKKEKESQERQEKGEEAIKELRTAIEILNIHKKKEEEDGPDRPNA